MKKNYLGIELGSTRIKAVLIDENGGIIASGNHTWENKFDANNWTYSLDDIWNGIQQAYEEMRNNFYSNEGVYIENIDGIGVSAMMHGYMAFDEKGNLLTPFRTWRNTTTEEAAKILGNEFEFNVPQRWSIAHLYQAILNDEQHVKEIDFITTLAGYVHYKLTGEKVIGVGDAAGMFPIDSKEVTYDSKMLQTFTEIVTPLNYSWKIEDILPKVLVAGEDAGKLTEEGAKLLDISNKLRANIPFCPPEGDAGTGMVATNSVSEKTGNISAGTSIFAMIVIDKKLSKIYEEIDMVTTPDGKPVAMVHCNNCTSDINAWVNLFKEMLNNLNLSVSMDDLYETFFKSAMNGSANCDGLLAYNYYGGEPITGIKNGKPMFLRNVDSNFSIENFARVHLYSAIATLKIGLEKLQDEGIEIDIIFGHGGFFKSTDVGQQLMASAIEIPISTLETADNGGAWGMAILASFMEYKNEMSLANYLEKQIFTNFAKVEMQPNLEDTRGFGEFMESYKKGLILEEVAEKI